MCPLEHLPPWQFYTMSGPSESPRHWDTLLCLSLERAGQAQVCSRALEQRQTAVCDEPNWFQGSCHMSAALKQRPEGKSWRGWAGGGPDCRPGAPKELQDTSECVSWTPRSFGGRLVRAYDCLGGGPLPKDLLCKSHLVCGSTVSSSRASLSPRPRIGLWLSWSEGGRPVFLFVSGWETSPQIS